MQDILYSDSYGNRTRVTAVKGRCLNRLTKEPSSSHTKANHWLPYEQKLYYHTFFYLARKIFQSFKIFHEKMLVRQMGASLFIKAHLLPHKSTIYLKPFST